MTSESESESENESESESKAAASNKWLCLVVWLFCGVAVLWCGCFVGGVDLPTLPASVMVIQAHNNDACVQ